MCKRILSCLLLAIACSASVYAAGGESLAPAKHANVNLKDKTSLQRGAQLYINYCLGCHSMKYQRYSRLGKDLEIPEDIIKENLIFTSNTKIGDQMRIGMDPQDSAKWFGKNPPDLSLITRRRSNDWVFNYLRGFYADDSKKYGVNNTVFPDVGMPHILAPLQGVQVKSDELLALESSIDNAKQDLDELHKACEANEADCDADLKSQLKVQVYHAEDKIKKLVQKDALFALAEQGLLTPEEYDAAMLDLVSFMAYVADPVKVERESLGVKVILFLLILFALAYALKKEFWKDVH